MKHYERVKKAGKQPIGRVFSNTFLMLGYIRKYVPGLVVWEAVIKLFDGALGTLNVVYLAKYVLDGVQERRSFFEMAPFLIGVIALNLCAALVKGYYEGSYKPRKSDILYWKMYEELFEKARRMELSRYDDPEFYNDFTWAMGGAMSNAMNTLTHTGDLLSCLMKIGATAAILQSVDSVGIYMAAGLLLVTGFVRKRSIRLQYQKNQEQKPLQRKRDYTSRVLYQPTFAKEIRLSNVKEKLTSNFLKANAELIRVIKKYARKTMLLDMLNWAFLWPVLYYGAYMGYLLYGTLVKSLYTYGGFYALFEGTASLFDDFEVLIDKVYAFTETSLYIEKFRTFLAYEPQMEQAEEPEEMPEGAEAVSLHHVTFSYPSAKEPVLKDVSLTIRPGEKVALVGYNGAGKSTLIKLLMRLYDPTEGSVRLGRTNVRAFDVSDYRRYFGVVFQDYQLLAATVGENVLMDRVTDVDEARIRQALSKSGFSERLASLEDGTKTHIGREFRQNGVNLSGGEGQKVAIARIFPRDCKVVILDEPSSALDPISEYNVNRSMLKAAKDKTVVFISHCLSTTRTADRIIMLEDGRIIEEGSHDELMEQNGKYAEMFRMQAKKYQNA